MDERWGKWIIILGIGLIVIGLIIKLFGRNLGWIGNLPGDIKVERENFKFYFPIVTMILFSVILNVVIRLFNYLK